MAVLALLCFALVALLASRGETVLENLGLAPNKETEQVHVLDLPDATLPKKISGAAGFADFPLRQHGEWTGLSGFTGHHNFDLPLPINTKFSDAVLFINIGAELEQDTTGRLRFGVNGQPRGEIVLNPGQSELLVKIPLQPIDKARKWVNVSISVLGNNPKAECTSDWTGGVVISVHPTTHVRVALEEPVTALEDRWILSGSPVRLVWPYPSKQVTNRPVIDLSWKWAPFVMDAFFVEKENARETDVRGPLSDLFEGRNKRISELQLYDQIENISGLEWPIPINSIADIDASREFRNRTSWNINFNRVDMPDQQLPDMLDFQLSISSADNEAAWLLNVLLNSQIVHSERIDPTEQLVARQVPLPLLSQALENNLRITLTSDEEKTGRCTQGHAAAAQLLEATVLDREQQTVDPIYAGILEVATKDVDLFATETVDAEEANFGFYTLSKIFRTTKFHTASSELKNHALERGLVVLMDSDRLTETLQRFGEPTGQAWIAFTAVTQATEPEVFAFKANDPLLKKSLELFKPISVLVVLPPGFKL
jgi:hypothetical protein